MPENHDTPETLSVAVYGTLRKGEGNHDLLSKSSYKGTYGLSGPFRMIDLGFFPAVMKSEGKGHITVEVYEVGETEMRSLDYLEGHPDFYVRELVETPVGPAWMYFMPEDRVGSRVYIDCGDWCEYDTRRLKYV